MIQAVGNNQHRITLAPDYKRVKSKEASTKTKVTSALGAAAGAGIALTAIAKKQGKGLMNIDYSLKEMLGIALGGVSGGVLGGVMTSEQCKHERKLDEGIFQYSMIAVPGLAVTGTMMGCEKVNALNKVPVKIFATCAAVAAGWKVAVETANFVSDIDNNEPDRKLKFKDAIASVDDLIGILVLMKVKAVKTMKLERILPFIYAFCGYKAGTTN